MTKLAGTATAPWWRRIAYFLAGGHPGVDLVVRLRIAFLRFGALFGLRVLAELPHVPAPVGLRVAGAVALAFILVWWFVGRRRGMFPLWSLPLEAAALFVVSVAMAGDAALGVFYAGVYFRALFESVRGAQRMAAVLFIAHAGSIAVAQAMGAPDTAVLSGEVLLQIPGFAVGAFVMSVITQTHRRHIRDLRQQQTLAAAGASLAEAQGPDDVGRIVCDAAVDVTGEGGAAAVALMSAGIPTVVATAGDASGEHLTAMDDEEHGRLLKGELVRAGAGTRVGLVLGGVLQGVIWVDQISDSDATTLSALASQASLALGRVRSMQATRASEARFRSLIENANEGVRVIAADGTVLFESESVKQLFGYDAAALVGRNAFELVHPDDVEPMRALVADIMDRPGGLVTGECRLLHHDGSWRQVEGSVRNLQHDPAVGGLVVNYRDISERKQFEAMLRHQALHDPLTGLPNRELFYDRVAHALARESRTEGSTAVMFIDIDDFKTINDAWGHAAGDAVLVAVAERLGQAARAVDTAARLGGDEFAILVEGVTDPGDVYDLGERVLLALNDAITADGHRVTIDASLGIVVSTGRESAAELIRNADLAMYRAKGSGKGRYEVFEIGMHEAVRERIRLKSDIERGVAAREFVPHFQPIVDLPSGQIVGFEALMRWEHPSRGVLPPAAFMSLAEDTGLIVPIGRDVLRAACERVAEWQREHNEDLTLSVNLSATELSAPGAMLHIREALAASGFDPRRLIVEITERMLLADADQASAALTELTNLGVRIALDDFGTGYSSLTHLERFPVSVVKIDKTFIDHLGAVGESPVTAAVIVLGGMLGVRVTAEGVEEPRQAERLQALGCDYAQGYYFAHPLPAQQVSTLMAPASAARMVVA